MSDGRPWFPPVDLDNCDREPIRWPGAIQPHGVLLAMDEATAVLRAASRNVDTHLGVVADACLGRPLAEVVGEGAALDVAAAAGALQAGGTDQLPLVILGSPVLATIYRTGPYLALEWEPGTAPAPLSAGQLRRHAIALGSARTVVDVVTLTARAVRSILGFDRVMVYQFDHDWHGEVVAEDKRQDLEPFFGLHYPATDIPVQARDLYRRNLLRLIVDIAYTPVEIVPPLGYGSDEPLDLADSQLRSVSPIHVEYLSNMGVRASLSLSLIVNDELWGLVACHHYSGPHHPYLEARNLAEDVARLAAARIREVVEVERNRRSEARAAAASDLLSEFAACHPDEVPALLRARRAEILATTGADGAVVVDGGECVAVGTTPDAAVIAACWRRWVDAGGDSYSTDCLGAEIGAGTGAIAGALAVALTSDLTSYVMWFRREQVRTVDWAGDPAKAKVMEEGDDGSVRLSPRKSFEKWKAVVSGRAQRFDETDVTSALRFARLLGSVLLRRDMAASVVAASLQQALLPASMPEVAGYRWDAYSAPDGLGRVGGDWYDVMALGERRIALVVGDVAGHGIHAAATMAQARNSLRAYLAAEADPSAVLEHEARYFLRALDGDIATAAVAVVDTTSGICEVVSAGHPPVLHFRRAEGACRPVAARGPLLGSTASTYDSTRVVMAPGDALVLYSDGVVEDRSTPLDTGIERLAGRVAEECGKGSPSAQAVVQAMTGGAHADDVTLLIASRI